MQDRIPLFGVDGLPQRERRAAVVVTVRDDRRGGCSADGAGGRVTAAVTPSPLSHGGCGVASRDGPAHLMGRV